jgi:lipase chaperone LimK
MYFEVNDINYIEGIDEAYIAQLSEIELDVLVDKLDSNELNRVSLLQPLIVKSNSMDDEEKSYWFDILEQMGKKHIKRLLIILSTEQKKLSALERKYIKELQTLNKKYEIKIGEK